MAIHLDHCEASGMNEFQETSRPPYLIGFHLLCTSLVFEIVVISTLCGNLKVARMLLKMAD